MALGLSLSTVGCLLCCLSVINGSKIIFTSSPKEMHPSLTKTLQLNCSLEDTGNPSVSGAIVGRSVTNTTTDVAHVTSILITRDGKDVATVTSYIAAKPMSDLTNLIVTGDVTGSSTTKGFLHLSWTYPTDQEMGEFTCDIAAVTDTGHTTVFSKTLEVNVVEASTADLKSYVNQLEIRLSQQEKETTTLQIETKNNEAKITALETELKNKDSQILDVLEEVKNTDSGTIQCGDSRNGGWVNAEGKWKAKTVTVQFKKAYRNTPIVHLSFLLVDDQHGPNDDNEFGVDLVSVNQQGFSMRCKSYRGINIDSMSASWASFPQF